MQDNSRVMCPYFISMSTDTKKMPTITCDNLETNLGFQVKNQLIFQNHGEKTDYREIFCEDMYDSCPYYQGIYKYQNDERRMNHEEKNKPD